MAVSAAVSDGRLTDPPGLDRTPTKPQSSTHWLRRGGRSSGGTSRAVAAITERINDSLLARFGVAPQPADSDVGDTSGIMTSELLANPAWRDHLQAGNPVFVPSQRDVTDLVNFILSIHPETPEFPIPAVFEGCPAGIQ